MLEVLRDGGFTTGGFNFDAKVRRQSIDAADLFHGHIGGVDTIAQGLVNAAAIIESGELERFRADRYSDWEGSLGKAIHADEASLASIAQYAIDANHSPEPKSGRQEWCENMVSRAQCSN